MEGSVRNKFDALMLLADRMMRTQGYVLIGLNEDVTFDEGKENVIPQGWNSSSDSWSFKYKGESGAVLVLKGIRLGEKILLCLMVVGGSDTYNLEIDVDMFVPEQDFEKGISYQNDDLFGDMMTEALLRQVNHSKNKVQVSSRIEEEHDPLRIPSEGNSRRPSSNIDDPLRIPGTGRNPLQMRDNRAPSHQPPFSVGDHDLYPSFGGGIPSGAPGNLVGPNHPGFGPGVQDPYYNDPYGVFAPQGGQQPGQPPRGARFDPYGPPGTNFGRPNHDHFGPPGFDGGFF